MSIAPLHAGGTVFAADYRCRAHGPFGPEESSARHDIVFLRSGMFLLEVEGRRHVADPARVVFFNRGATYRIGHPVEGGDDCFILSLAGSELLEALSRADPSVVDRPDRPFVATTAPCPPRAYALQRALRSRMQTDRPDALEVQEAAFDLVDAVASLAVERRASVPPSRARTARRHRDLAVGVQTILAGAFARPVTLASLARASGASPYHLSRVFRRETGMPIHRYLLDLRLCAVLERLADGAEDIGGLALDWGFADHAHLTRAFRRAFGCSPSQWRRIVHASLPAIEQERSSVRAMPRIPSGQRTRAPRGGNRCSTT